MMNRDLQQRQEHAKIMTESMNGAAGKLSVKLTVRVADRCRVRASTMRVCIPGPNDKKGGPAR